VRFTTFLRFVGPSAALMLLLLALPLAVTFYLSVRTCAMQMEVVTVTESSPFGTKEVVTQRAVLGPDGRALSVCRFIGLEYFRKVLGLETGDGDQVGSTAPPDASGAGVAPATAAPQRATEFMGALRFTLLYTFATTPFVLLLGFALALGVNQVG